MLIFRLAILLMNKVLGHTDIPMTTHLGLPNLCTKSSKKPWLTDMKLINEMLNRLKLMSFAVVLVILHKLWSFS